MKDKKKYLNDLIVDCLRERPFISVHSLEKQTGLPQASLNKAVKGQSKVPMKHVWKLLKALSPYGLQINGKFTRVQGDRLELIEPNDILYIHSLDDIKVK